MADSGALIIGIGKPKGEPMGDKMGEVCVPLSSLSTNDGSDEGEGNVSPEVGDIVNPDMRVTRIDGENAYLEAVGTEPKAEEAGEAKPENMEEDLMNKAKQVDQSGSY
jgi:hypothetical protein